MYKYHFGNLIIFVLISFNGIGQSIDTSFAPTFTVGGIGFHVKVQSDDRILVSGNFELATGRISKGFSRLLPNGEFDDSFNYDPDLIGNPRILEVQHDGKIIIGGKFMNKEGIFVSRILRLNTNGSQDRTFHVIEDSIVTFHKIIILPNQKIFTSYFRCDPNVTANCFVYGIRLYQSNGEADHYFAPIEFKPNHTSGSSSSIADIAAQSDNALIVMGTSLEYETFDQMGYRFDSMGVVDPIFDPDITSISNFIVKNIDVFPNGTIGILAGDDENITILDSLGNTILTRRAGNDYSQIVATKDTSFLVVGSSLVHVILNGSGATISNPNGVNYYVSKLSAQSQGVIAVGLFNQSNGRLVPGIARFIFDNIGVPHLDEEFQGILQRPGTVSSMVVQEDRKIVAGGNFSHVNGSPINHLVRLNIDGSIDFSFGASNNTNPSTTINAIKQLSDQSLIIGGRYNIPGTGALLNGLSQFDKDGHFIQQISFPFKGSSTSISYMTKDKGDNIYAGEGLAYSINGESGQELMKYNFNGTSYSSTNYNEQYIDGLYRFNGLNTIHNNNLLIYGLELRYDGSDTSSIIKVLENGERDVTFETDLPNNYIASDAVSVNSNKIYISGRLLDNSSGRSSGAFYRLDRSGIIDLSYKGLFMKNGLSDYQISVLDIIPNGSILVSGNFDSYNRTPIPAGNLLMDTLGTLISEFLPEQLDGPIRGIEIIDSSAYYIFGSFIGRDGGSGIMRISSCFDNIMNGYETAIDCGGKFCRSCSNCSTKSLLVETDDVYKPELTFNDTEELISTAIISFDNTTFISEKSIILDLYFEVESELIFTVEIEPCK